MTGKPTIPQYETAQQVVLNLFAAPVSVCVADAEMFDAPICPEEFESISRAVSKRRREFSAGRNAARRALAELGAPVGPIPVNHDRSPMWPIGYVGSISHCDGFCGAVVGRKPTVSGLGFDAECTKVLPLDIAALVYDANEADHFSTLPCPIKADWGKLAFSAKEAFYKCHSSVTGGFLEFLDVSVFFSINNRCDAGTFSISTKLQSGFPSKRKTAGRWRIWQNFIFTGVVANLRD